MVAAAALGAYEAPAEGNQYASKTELLEWINGLLQLQLSRLEQFASGAVFCQLLDAYFKDAIPMSKVNYHASNEYEAVPNYKVLQQGFTAINLTRDIRVSKLARGSRVELLELLQYLYKYLLKLKAQEGYDGRGRRAITVKGGTDVPLPSWMSGSQAAGRGGINRSSGNWGPCVEQEQSHGPGLRASGSFNPGGATASRAAARTSASAATAGASAEPGSHRKPCTPSRIPSASPRREAAAAAGSPAAGALAAPSAGSAAAGPAPAAGSAAAVPAAPAAGPVGKHVQESAAEDEAGVAVFRVLPKAEEDEEAGTRAAADDPGSTTRLVIPDEVISSSMIRPLSPGSCSQLEMCLGAAGEAVRVLEASSSSMQQINASLPTCCDSYVYRGKIKSLLDASATTAGHAALLLGDVAAVCSCTRDGSAAELLAQASTLQQQLGSARQSLDGSSAGLAAVLAARPLASQQQLNLHLTQLQKQLASTAALDGCLRAMGAAYAALLARSHREAAAAAASFLQQGPGAASGAAASEPTAAPCSVVAVPGAGSQAGVTSRVLKLGDCALKRLRNGDVYRGRYQGLRKNGEGSYCFVNADVYEGEFRDDRMAGRGVYSFAPEGRYEGEWASAVYEGHGSETFAKGSTYRGQYAAGLRHGHGVCRFFNGDYYEGQWSKGLRDGSGMQQCTDDSNYTGQYVRGKRHGYGVYSFPNGDQYLGEYEDDIPHGYGVYVFGSGQKYEGHWDKGKKHGWSVYTVETGQRWAGSWADGKPQWVHPLPPAGGQGDDAQPAPAPEAADNLSHAHAACKNAQEACALAVSTLEAHWATGGQVQEGLGAAVRGAMQACAAAQAARARAQQLAARLDAAAALVEDGGRGGQMRLVTHQLGALTAGLTAQPQKALG